RIKLQFVKSKFQLLASHSIVPMYHENFWPCRGVRLSSWSESLSGYILIGKWGKINREVRLQLIAQDLWALILDTTSAGEPIEYGSIITTELFTVCDVSP